MKLADWEKAGRLVDCWGHSVFCREEGDGEVLALIHGYPTASWDWHRVWPALAQRFRLIAFDMIGFGFSAKPRSYSYSIVDQATSQEHLLGELGIERLHILAHDYGVSVAQELLARQLEGVNRLQVQSVAFLNGGLIPGTHNARLIQKLLNSPLGGIVARLTSRSRFGSNFSAIFAPGCRPEMEELDQFWRLLNHNQGLRVQRQIARYQTERNHLKDRWVGALQRTDVPMRFICGVEDPISGVPVAESYRELVPNPDVVLLDEVGHYPQVEAPEAVLAALSEFWEMESTAQAAKRRREKPES